MRVKCSCRYILPCFQRRADLDLGLDNTAIDDCSEDNIKAEYLSLQLSHQSEIANEYIFALFLAKKAIENENIKECLIYISSSNAPGRIADSIAKLLNPSDKDNILIERGNSRSLREDRVCLQLLTDANNTFNKKYQITIESLAFDLLDANFHYKIVHPINYSQIPRDLNCYSIFTTDTPSIQSYAALFLASDKHNGSWRHIKIESFAKLLKIANINITISLENSETIEVPMQPGMLFIINLINFLISMEINEINLAYQEDKQEVDLSFEVREIERFSSAILTGCGRNSSWKFRYLMGCRKNIIYDTQEQLEYGTENIFADWANKRELTEQEKESKKEIISSWNPRLLSSEEEGESSIYPAFLRWDRDWKSNDNRIHIKWDSKSCKSNPDPLIQLKK